jgi:hypothetical protein
MVFHLLDGIPTVASSSFPTAEVIAFVLSDQDHIAELPKLPQGMLAYS